MLLLVTGLAGPSLFRVTLLLSELSKMTMDLHTSSSVAAPRGPSKPRLSWLMLLQVNTLAGPSLFYGTLLLSRDGFARHRQPTPVLSPCRSRMFRVIASPYFLRPPARSASGPRDPGAQGTQGPLGGPRGPFGTPGSPRGPWDPRGPQGSPGDPREPYPGNPMVPRGP